MYIKISGNKHKINIVNQKGSSSLKHQESLQIFFARKAPVRQYWGS